MGLTIVNILKQIFVIALELLFLLFYCWVENGCTSVKILKNVCISSFDFQQSGKLTKFKSLWTWEEVKNTMLAWGENWAFSRSFETQPRKSSTYSLFLIFYKLSLIGLYSELHNSLYVTTRIGKKGRMHLIYDKIVLC